MRDTPNSMEAWERADRTFRKCWYFAENEVLNMMLDMTGSCGHDLAALLEYSATSQTYHQPTRSNGVCESLVHGE